MDKQQSTRMPKPFENDHELNASPTQTTEHQFELQEDETLKQEDYRQGRCQEYVFISRRFFLLLLRISRYLK